MNFLSVVIVTAPDFRRHDFLEEADQMTLPKAFAELRHGVELLEAAGYAGGSALRTLLASAQDAYADGDRRKGAHLLQDFEDLAFPNSFA
ncbi:hypothetical protein ACFPPF_11370 [Xenophilus aerolatus]|nr:hypothetical protein [Xenophilus aerolatus]